MYSNDAVAMPKSSFTSAVSGMRPCGVRRTLSCAGVDERDRRRIVDDRLDGDDALDAPVGETQRDRLRRRPCRRSTSDRRARSPRASSVSTVRDDAGRVAAPAQRDRAADERADVARLVDRRRALAGVRRRLDLRDEWREPALALAVAIAGGRANRRRCGLSECDARLLAGTKLGTMNATAIAASAGRRRARPLARARGRRPALGRRRAATNASSPVSTAVTSAILERRIVLLDPQRDAVQRRAPRGRARAARRRPRRTSRR